MIPKRVNSVSFSARGPCVAATLVVANKEHRFFWTLPEAQEFVPEVQRFPGAVEALWTAIHEASEYVPLNQPDLVLLDFQVIGTRVELYVALNGEPSSSLLTPTNVRTAIPHIADVGTLRARLLAAADTAEHNERTLQ